MRLYETITKENWRNKPAGFEREATYGCVLAHLQRQLGIPYHEVLESEPYGRLREAILILFPERWGDGRRVGGFNDHPDTTVDDVIRVCKIADV